MSVSNSKTSSTTAVDQAGALPALDIEKAVPAKKIITWDGPDDPQNPRNWSKRKRWLITFEACGWALTVSMTASIATQAVPEMAAEFGVGQIISTMTLSLYVIGWAMAPLIFAPISELYGRNIIYGPAWLLFCCFCVGCAVAKNIETLLVCRLLAGMASSPSITNNAGTLSDIWNIHEQGVPFGILLMFSSVGTVLGPICGGALAQHGGWRWCFYFVTIFAGALLVPTFITPETHAPTLLSRKAAALRKKTGDLSYRSEQETRDMTTVDLIKISTLRPMWLLAASPLVTLAAIYISFLSGVLYLYFGAYPRIFRGVYLMDQTTSGLAFIGMCIGVVSAGLTSFYTTKLYRREKNPAPEARLPMACVAAVLSPATLFWFAWSGRQGVHWIVPVLSGVPFGWCIINMMTCLLTYVAESNPDMAASAQAAVFFVRSLTIAGFPLFMGGMYTKLGNAWAGSTLGFVTVALAPIPFCFYKFGAKLRGIRFFELISAAKA